MDGLLGQRSFEHSYPFHALHSDVDSFVPNCIRVPPPQRHLPIPVAKQWWRLGLQRRSTNVRQRTEPSLLRTEPGTKICVVLRPFKEATHGSHIDPNLDGIFRM